MTLQLDNITNIFSFFFKSDFGIPIRYTEFDIAKVLFIKLSKVIIDNLWQPLQ